jgi:hypothetical protein
MLTRQGAPIIFKLSFPEIFFVFGPPLLLAQSASLRHTYWRIINKMIIFVGLAYFHANCILTGLDTIEMEIH